MNSLPPEFIVYVENFWKEYNNVSKLFAQNNKVPLFFELKELLEYHIEHNSTDRLENNLTDLVHKCSHLLKKAKKKANNAEKHILHLEAIKTEYHLFLESYGVDLDSRLYDEEFYTFIHGNEDDDDDDDEYEDEDDVATDIGMDNCLYCNRPISNRLQHDNAVQNRKREFSESQDFINSNGGKHIVCGCGNTFYTLFPIETYPPCDDCPNCGCTHYP